MHRNNAVSLKAPRAPAVSTRTLPLAALRARRPSRGSASTSNAVSRAVSGARKVRRESGVTGHWHGAARGRVSPWSALRMTSPNVHLYSTQSSVLCPRRCAVIKKTNMNQPDTSRGNYSATVSPPHAHTKQNKVTQVCYSVEDNPEVQESLLMCNKPTSRRGGSSSSNIPPPSLIKV